MTMLVANQLQIFAAINPTTHREVEYKAIRMPRIYEGVVVLLAMLFFPRIVRVSFRSVKTASFAKVSSRE